MVTRKSKTLSIETVKSIAQNPDDNWNEDIQLLAEEVLSWRQKKDLDYYMGLPWTYELKKEPEGGWFIRVKELPGCASQGNTLDHAMYMIRDAMTGWLEIELEDGEEIPEPPVNEIADMLNEIFADRVKDPEFQKEYNKLGISNDVIHARYDNDETQEDLAKGTGLSINTIRRIEEGKSVPLWKLWKIAEYYHQSIGFKPYRK